MFYRIGARASFCVVAGGGAQSKSHASNRAGTGSRATAKFLPAAGPAPPLFRIYQIKNVIIDMGILIWLWNTSAKKNKS